MFCSLTQCAEGISQPFRIKVNVTREGQMFEPAFRVRSIFPTFLKGFS